MTSEQFAQEIVALTDTLYRVSYSILREKCDREDAVQGCLEKAWKKRARAARRALPEDVAGAHTPSTSAITSAAAAQRKRPRRSPSAPPRRERTGSCTTR